MKTLIQESNYVLSNKNQKVIDTQLISPGANVPRTLRIKDNYFHHCALIEEDFFINDHILIYREMKKVYIKHAGVLNYFQLLYTLACSYYILLAWLFSVFIYTSALNTSCSLTWKQRVTQKFTFFYSKTANKSDLVKRCLIELLISIQILIFLSFKTIYWDFLVSIKQASVLNYFQLLRTPACLIHPARLITLKILYTGVLSRYCSFNRYLRVARFASSANKSNVVTLPWRKSAVNPFNGYLCFLPTLMWNATPLKLTGLCMFHLIKLVHSHRITSPWLLRPSVCWQTNQRRTLGLSPHFHQLYLVLSRDFPQESKNRGVQCGRKKAQFCFYISN